MFGPSRSMRRVPVAILLRMESAVSSPSILRRHSSGSGWEAMSGRVPFPGLHDLEEVHGAPHRDRRGREVIRYEQLHLFVQVHTFAVATITGGSAPVMVAHHVGQPGVARGEQPAAHGVTERPPEITLAAPHLRDHGDDLADLDPLARREAGDAVAAELSLPRERDTLDAGGGGGLKRASCTSLATLRSRQAEASASIGISIRSSKARRSQKSSSTISRSLSSIA